MQPVPTKTESELVNQVARLTQSKRTDVIKNALAVYNWSVCHAMTGARLIARIRQEKRLSLRLPNSSPLKPKAIASAPRNSAYLPRSSRTPRVPMPPAVFRHLLDRIQNRKIPLSRLELLALWHDTEPDVPEGESYKRFSGMVLCGEDDLIKAFLLPGQLARSKRVN